MSKKNRFHCPELAKFQTVMHNGKAYGAYTVDGKLIAWKNGEGNFLWVHKDYTA